MKNIEMESISRQEQIDATRVGRGPRMGPIRSVFAGFVADSRLFRQIGDAKPTIGPGIQVK
jgi:hypothetical protein